MQVPLSEYRDTPWRSRRMASGSSARVLFAIGCIGACWAIACPPDDGSESSVKADGIEQARQVLTKQLLRGMPWETVRAKAIHVRRLDAISVRASVRLNCPNVRIVPYAPVRKDTGMREFAHLDLIEVDRLEAHHVEAAEIVADEVVAMRVDGPTPRGK